MKLLFNEKHQNQLPTKIVLYWRARTSVFAPWKFGGYLPWSHYSVQTRALCIWISELQHQTSPSHEGIQPCKNSQELLEILTDSLHSAVCIHQYSSQHINKREFCFLGLCVQNSGEFAHNDAVTLRSQQEFIITFSH